MRVAVLGLGFMGRVHLQALREIPGVELGAVVRHESIEVRAGNLENAAGPIDFSRVRKYRDVASALADPEVAAVDICLPTDLHERVTLEALRQGKHVLVEKPMALDRAACDRMIEAADRAKRILMVAHVLRFFPAYQALELALVHAGEIRSATLRRRCALPDWAPWQRDTSRSGGAVLDLLIHDLDMILHLVCAYTGESYADIAAVERTVGFVPHATREARERRTIAVSDFAAALGVPGIACHVGCIPADRAHPDYDALINVTRRICDHAASHDQTFALETGQEPALALLRFLGDVSRGNLKINFDPANMILYGTGDPMEAFEILASQVVSVHAKDGDWPTAPGRLGVERPLGAGSVGIPRFVETLQRHSFHGTVNVEHEIEDRARRLIEIRDAVQLLTWTAACSASSEPRS